MDHAAALQVSHSSADLAGNVFDLIDVERASLLQKKLFQVDAAIFKNHVKMLEHGAGAVHAERVCGCRSKRRCCGVVVRSVLKRRTGIDCRGKMIKPAHYGDFSQCVFSESGPPSEHVACALDDDGL